MNAPAPAQGGDAQRNLAGRQLGRYEVLTQLASGGMAAVYIARAQGLAGFERLVAIKVLHPHLAYEEEFISMFLDEARLAARIRHPNVVGTLDISDSQGDGYFLVMDYIEGDHLGALLGRSAKQGKRLPSPVVLRVVLDALGGLGAAHNLTDENGAPLHLVHRDVSPHNIMVGTDGIGRLTDFGVAKAEVRMASTRAGQFKGKLSYMAPEQASSGHSDQRSDLFSMGIILWESLTGRRLFRGENNAATLNKILQEPIPTPSSQWPELTPFDSVLMKALDRDPDARYQTADEFIEAIEKAGAELEGVASPRQVGLLVQELLGEKLVAEQRRVKEAIETFGKAEIGEATMPIPRDGSQASSVSYSGSRAATGQHPHLSDPSIQIQHSGHPSSGGLKTAVMALAIAILVAAGVAVWQLNRDAGVAAEPETTPATAEEPATAEGSATAETEEVAPSLEPNAAEDEREREATAGTEDEAATDTEAQAEVEDESDEAASARQRRRRAAALRRATAQRRRAEARSTGSESTMTGGTQETATPMTSGPSEMTGSSNAQRDLFLNPYRR